MKKYILIFALLLPIIFYFTPDISAQTTDLNQKAACNSKRNGDSCSYQEISGSRGQTNNTSKQGFCDRINGGSNANSNTLICKSGNEADSWEDCVVVGDKCKDKASKKEGQCITKTTGSGRGTLTQIVCNASGAPTTSCVTNAERDDKCGTGNKCTGGQVCANIDNTVKCVTNAERDNKCGTGNKCTGNQVCVTQSAKVDTASTGTPSSSSSSSSATTTAGTVTYQSYTNFPGVGRISSLCQLITALWLLGFAVLLTSVLGMFLWGGYIYVTAGVNAGKVNQAKEIFTNTIIGLIIGLSIFIIINIINPGLLQGNCSIPSVGSGATVGGPAGPSNIIPKPGESVFPVTYLYQGPSGGQLYGAPRSYGPHSGIDFTPCWADIVSGGVPYTRSGWESQPILAFRDGTVTRINERGLNDVRIRHADGVETRYTHNSRVLVSVGQEVKAGQEIAKLGEKGAEGAPHLHFDVFVNGSTVNPANILLDASRQPDPSKVKTTGSPKSACAR